MRHIFALCFIFCLTIFYSKNNEIDHAFFRIKNSPRRNPMYLGFVLLIIASGMALQSMLFPLVCSPFIVYMTHFQIIPEERALNALFPKDFNLYCQKTKRWI
jgi:hypothetical protein